MILALAAMLAGACNEPKETTPPVIKAGSNGNAAEAQQAAEAAAKPIFREEEPEGGWPDGIPPTLAAAAHKHWKYQKKISTGMVYIEMRFFKDHLLMKNQLQQPWWDTVHFELHADTIFPQRKNAQTGQLEGTNDFFLIHRVWGDDMNVTSYDLADPTKITEIPFSRVVNDVEEAEAAAAATEANPKKL